MNYETAGQAGDMARNSQPQRGIGPATAPMSLVRKAEMMQETLVYLHSLLARFENLNDRITGNNRPSPAQDSKAPPIPPIPSLHADLLLDRLTNVRVRLEDELGRLEQSIFG